MVRKEGFPQSRNIPGTEDVRIRFLPDSPEFIAQVANGMGYRPKLERVVREAIARVNRRWL